MPSETFPGAVVGDADLEQRIFDALKSHRLSLRHVTIEARQGTITLAGEVNSFYAKQLLQHSARRHAGDSPVIDEVNVVTPVGSRDTPRLCLTAAAGALLLLTLFSLGCGQAEPERVAVFPVTGQVLFEGRPAAGAVVTFHPKDKNIVIPAPHARADAQGNFVLTTYRAEDGAPVGEYLITVELRRIVPHDGEYVPGPNLLPPKYSVPKTTDLVARVAEGSNTVPIRIVR